MFGRADAEDALRTACVRAGLSDLDRRLDRWATWAQIALRIPAIRLGIPRYRRSARPDPFKRQEAQIVQSCKTLDDFLPGFWLPPVRWSDIDTERHTIRWRGEHEKTGYEHRTPVTAEALAVLEEARMHNPGIGDSPVLPAPKDPLASGAGTGSGSFPIPRPACSRSTGRVEHQWNALDLLGPFATGPKYFTSNSFTNTHRSPSFLVVPLDSM